MTRQEQDKLWNDLSEEMKRKYRDKYGQLSWKDDDSDHTKGKKEGMICILVDIFGTHNLTNLL